MPVITSARAVRAGVHRLCAADRARAVPGPARLRRAHPRRCQRAHARRAHPGQRAQGVGALLQPPCIAGSGWLRPCCLNCVACSGYICLQGWLAALLHSVLLRAVWQQIQCISLVLHGRLVEVKYAVCVNGCKCRLQAGLNGVDNGQIWFYNVRVPRDALLDRCASIRCVHCEVSACCPAPVLY